MKIKKTKKFKLILKDKSMKWYYYYLEKYNILYLYLSLKKEPIIGYLKKRLNSNMSNLNIKQYKQINLLKLKIKKYSYINVIKDTHYKIYFKMYNNIIITNKNILIINYINNYIDTDINLFIFFKKTNKVDMIVDIVEKNKQINNSNIHYLEYNIKNINKKIIFKKDIIIISAFSYYTKFNKKELMRLPRIIYQSIIGLNNLIKGGDMYFFIYTFEYNVTIQFLYILSKQFKYMEVVPNKLWFGYNMIIFKKYNGTHNIDKLLKQYYKYDKTLGQKYSKGKEFDFSYDFDVNVPIEFITELNRLDEANGIIIDDIIDNYKKVKQLFETTDNEKKLMNKLIKNNIKHSIDFCKKHNIKVNPFYLKFKKYDIDKLKYYMFPKIGNVELNKILLTKDSSFSVSYPKEAREITKLILSYYPNIKTIADMCANVGGNSIDFCQNFDFVHSIEIDKETSKALENNLKLYKFKNFKVHNMDSNKFNKKVDFYFYDPPWGGENYYMNILQDLFLGDMNIIDVIKTPFCIKVPNNYNIGKLLTKFNKLYIHKLDKYIILISNNES